MNIYEKMQDMRCKLQAKALKKSGKNKFAGYEYFELQDIIPTINSLMQEAKVTSEIRFTAELAILRIVNAEKPDEDLKFSCPMANATLKGCHEVQNLGASITYIRRYLYINAFEVVEHDALDNAPAVEIEYITKEEVKKLLDDVVEVGFDKQMFLDYMKIESIEKMVKADLPKAQEAIALKRKKNAENK